MVAIIHTTAFRGSLLFCVYKEKAEVLPPASFPCGVVDRSDVLQRLTQVVAEGEQEGDANEKEAGPDHARENGADIDLSAMLEVGLQNFRLDPDAEAGEENADADQEPALVEPVIDAFVNLCTHGKDLHM